MSQTRSGGDSVGGSRDELTYRSRRFAGTNWSRWQRSEALVAALVGAAGTFVRRIGIGLYIRTRG